GFRDLSVKSTPPPEPKPEPKPIVAAPPPRPFYSAGDAEATPPNPIQQSVPKYPGNVMRISNGIVEFIVDETGAVQSPMMRASIDSQYDQMVIAAARKWRYQPATVNGKPVKYLKRLSITVKPNNQ